MPLDDPHQTLCAIEHCDAAMHWRMGGARAHVSLIQSGSHGVYVPQATHVRLRRERQTKEMH